ncbi:cytochrome b [Methylopila sp. Yamaguchi]|uniref:cytochrome b n=1 Tax=Methylopila sp. Yamaguchi TaxID=1437817 RepID=UPI000CB30B1E|nr:cytochrome b/b6 domain-containing protein [Methylopila sp. Yamaguchi]GBD50361.1 cytochrome b561 [Methylopila sp. Yamaguchi]
MSVQSREIAAAAGRPDGVAFDSPRRYGLVTRLFHGTLAALVLWQFTIVALYKIFGETPWLNGIARFGPHGYVGLAVLVIAVCRSLWRLSQLRRQPPQERGARGRLARLSHLALHALMIVVPALALVRIYGKGKGLEIGGVTLIPATGREEPWLIAGPDALHGPLSWALLVLIAGHVGMALAHTLVWRDGTLGRMFGRL